MKTTLELPDDLMRQAKVRAALEGRRLKDVMTDLIRRGLAQELSPEAGERRKVKLPLIECAHAAPAGQEMTPDRVAEILAQDEVSGSWQDG